MGRHFDCFYLIYDNTKENEASTEFLSMMGEIRKMVQGNLPVDSNGPVSQRQDSTSNKLRIYCDAMICCFENPQEPSDDNDKAPTVQQSMMRHQEQEPALRPCQIFEVRLSQQE